ncbi:MAG: hypothetical protein IPJ74_26475 [Saprospiraceae bacterium]|nr:hypothetical protein [Saprospiraceae bacterium]
MDRSDRRHFNSGDKVFVAGPGAKFHIEAPVDQEDFAVVEIDKQRTENVRRIWPFFRDRRIDAYGDLGKRYID